MLETVREYAIERLSERREAVESALVAWMVELVASLPLGFSGPAQLSGLDQLDVELDNFRAALRYAAKDPDPTRELALTSESGLYWRVRGHVAEGRAIYDGILERRGLVPTTGGVRVARQAANLAWATGDRERAKALGEAVLQAAEQIGDAQEQSGALTLLGMIENVAGNVEASLRRHQEAVRRAEDEGLEQALAIARLNLGVVYMDAGWLDEARDRFQAVLDYHLGVGSPDGIGYAHLNLGETEFKAGNLAEAEAHFAAAAEGFRAFGHKIRFANALQGLAAVEARTGRAVAAAKNLGHAASILQGTGWAADGVGLVADATRAAREALGDEAFQRSHDEGASIQDR